MTGQKRAGIPRRHLAAVAVWALALASAGIAQAATITVNTTADEFDANSDCSLREAVGGVERDPGEACAPEGEGPIEIMLPPGTYTLSVSSPCTFASAFGGAPGTAPLVPLCPGTEAIVGAGSATTVIEGNLQDRVIIVSRDVNASLTGVTIAKGRQVGGTFIGGGAGILNHGTLTLTDVIVRNNVADAGGGGIYNAGTLTLASSAVSQNLAGFGGGLANAGDAVLTRSAVRDNRSGSNGGGGGIQNFFVVRAGIVTLIDSEVSGNTTDGSGGGIFSQTDVIVTRSTISGNTAPGQGGGIDMDRGPLTMTSSTVSGNAATAGGGIWLSYANSSPSTIDGTTITGNRATAGAAGLFLGGGIYSGTGLLTLSNSIVAGNTTGSLGPDCAGGITSAGHNLIGDGSGCGFVPAGADGGDQVGTSGVPIDPRLVPLADNGGPTITHALCTAAGEPHESCTGRSPAVDAGNPAAPGSGGNACAAVDQRGNARPVDGDGDGTATCDSGSFEAAQGVGELSASHVRPGRAGNTGPVCALVYGRGFRTGVTVKLTRDGEPDIPGAPVKVDEGGSTIATAFDLAGRTPGPWNLVVMNPNGASATVAGAFLVEAGGAPRVWAEILGPSALLIGRPMRHFLLYGNRGNVDARAVPLMIAAPKTVQLELRFPLAPPPRQPGSLGLDWSVAPVEITSDGLPDQTTLALLVPLIPAGGIGVVEFWVTAPAEMLGQLVQVAQGIGTPYTSDGVPVEGTVDGLAEGVRAYAERVFRFSLPEDSAPSIKDYIRRQLRDAVDAGTQDCVDNVGRSPGLGGAGGRIYCLACFTMDGAATATSDSGGGGGIPPDFPRGAGSTCQEASWQCCAPPPCTCPTRTRACSCPPPPGPVVGSRDPNEKVGSEQSANRVMSNEAPLRYAVFFENVGNAPAQRVVVTDQLDMATMDLGSFSLGPMVFGDRQVIPPPGLSSFSTDVDFRPDKALICRITASLDKATGLLTWSLISLDPVTGEAPEDPFLGCLPPNLTPPEGDGSFTITLGSKPGLATGTRICNRASIVFDVNDAIATGEVCNTLDTIKPTSQIDSVQATLEGLQLAWSGADEGSGIEDFTIFASEDGGPFVPFLVHTAGTTGTFVGTCGKQYRFYSTARDKALNVEDPPSTPDATVTLADCDLALTQLTGPADITLRAGEPVTRTVKVTIQNRGRHNEVIPDAATLAALVQLTVESLGPCPAPVPALAAGVLGRLPFTLKPRKKLTVPFTVAFGCANDPLTSTQRDPGHEDYRLSAMVDHTALGSADAHPGDDMCPRSVSPPGEIDPNPDATILDKGCGKKKRDGTYGAPVLVDVLVRP